MQQQQLANGPKLEKQSSLVPLDIKQYHEPTVECDSPKQLVNQMQNLEKQNQISPEHQKYIDHIYKIKQDIDNIKNVECGWKKVEEKKQVIGYIKEGDKKGDLLARGEGIVNASYDIIYDLLTNFDKIPILNKTTKFDKILEKINDKISIRYNRSYVPLIDDRISCFVLAEIQDKKNEIKIVSSSVDHPENVIPKGCVLATCDQTWYLEKLNDNQCNLIQISLINAGGSLPTYFVNKGIKARGVEQVLNVKQYCEKQDMLQYIGSQFLRNAVSDGKDVIIEHEQDLSKTEITGVYFSAAWCGPCQYFTPKLNNLYNKWKSEKKSFEVVYVSNDHSEREFIQYFYSKMNFLAIPYQDKMRISVLAKIFRPVGIPTLIILDEKGRMLSKDGKYELESRNDKAYDYWQQLRKQKAAQLD